MRSARKALGRPDMKILQRDTGHAMSHNQPSMSGGFGLCRKSKLPNETTPLWLLVGEEERVRDVPIVHSIGDTTYLHDTIGG